MSRYFSRPKRTEMKGLKTCEILLKRVSCLLYSLPKEQNRSKKLQHFLVQYNDIITIWTKLIFNLYVILFD